MSSEQPVRYHRDDVVNYAADAHALADRLSTVTVAHVENAGSMTVGGTGAYADGELAFVAALQKRCDEAHARALADTQELARKVRTSATMAETAVRHYDQSGSTEGGLSDQLANLIRSTAGH